LNIKTGVETTEYTDHTKIEDYPFRQFGERQFDGSTQCARTLRHYPLRRNLSSVDQFIPATSLPMTPDDIQFKETRDISIESVVELYKSVGWSSAEKPVELHQALLGSHSLVTAWDSDRLVGLGNAISDGHLVVYYSHLLVHPEYEGRGIGTRLMKMLMAHYQGFHQHRDRRWTRD
jgi:ribosomal protein S18 acetylase RimI-like enzyme